VYDNICKFLAETRPTDIATWLLGEPITLVELSPKELSLEPIRSDSLILWQSSDLVLHAEFQTSPQADIPFRMADYRLRIYRRYPNKRVYQVVVYLQPTNSPLVNCDYFEVESMRHQFSVIRLWEQPTSLFLDLPGLLPFAPLSQTDNRENVLRDVARRIDTISDRRLQSNIAASTSMLAGLILDKEMIQRVLRQDIMKESVIYQELRQEALAEGRAEGKAEGIAQGIQQVARNLLNAGIGVEQVANYTGLSVEQVRELLQ
jgi:predicted transposase/invertase (TIGR01784 family)